jgi:hypothetical protein
LACDQLKVLAAAAYLAGIDGASDQAWTRAFHLHQRADDARRAVRCAFWLAFRLLNVGDVPQGSGCVARICRLLERCPDSVEQGYGSYGMRFSRSSAETRPARSTSSPPPNLARGSVTPIWSRWPGSVRGVRSSTSARRGQA